MASKKPEAQPPETEATETEATETEATETEATETRTITSEATKDVEDRSRGAKATEVIHVTRYDDGQGFDLNINGISYGRLYEGGCYKIPKDLVAALETTRVEFEVVT